MRRIDPLIAGGGPAGAAAAIMLAQTGARPVVLERQRETGDALCGGFLSWRTLQTLETLGLGAIGGHRIDRLRLFAGNSFGEALLPHPAMGVSRHRLDSLLLARAESLGAGVERGVTVRGWSEGRIETGDGATLTPETLFLATGKHDLRGMGRSRDALENQTIGIRVRLSPHPALEALAGNAIELHLFDQGYCGLELQEGGRGNLCLAVRKSRLTLADGDPDRLLAQWAAQSPAFAERLAFRDSGSEAIGAVPYGWIAHHAVPGVFRLGDQAAVIPSLAGEGNGIAMASGIMAAQGWLAGETPQAFQSRLADATSRPVTIARWLWHWGEQPNSARLLTQGVRFLPWLAGRFAEWTRIRH